MSNAEINQRTLGRALQGVVSYGQWLEKGANYLKNHEIRTFLLQILTLGFYTPYAKEEIRGKKQLLHDGSDKLIEAIINTKTVGNGNYRVSFQMVSNNDTKAEEQYVLDYQDTFNTLSIWRAGNSADVEILHDISFKGLKKALLKYYLEKARKDGETKFGNEPIDLSSTKLDLSDIDDFEGINFENARLDRENLETVVSKKGNLRGVNLAEDTDLSGLDFKDIPIDRPILALLAYKVKVQKQEVSLQGVDLSGQNLSGLNLEGLDLTEANLEKAKCHGTFFNSAILTRAKCADADFTKANFSLADLTQIVKSEKTEFTETRFRAITTDDIKNIFSKETLPQGAILSPDVVRALLERNHKNFAGIKLDYPEQYSSPASLLEDTNNLSNLTFDNANLSRTEFHGTNLSGTTFKEASLAYISIDRNTDLTDTDFTNANFEKADLSQTKFKDSTIITNVKIRKAKLSRSFVKQAIKQNLHNLTDADLSGADLRGLDLTGLVLDNVNLAGAKLEGATLNLSGFKAALESRATTRKNDETGQEERFVDLKNVILKGTEQEPLDLTRLETSGVDFSGATLEHCMLYDLTNMDLSNVDMSTVTLLNAKGANSVTVQDTDCEYYENQFKRRLSFILDGVNLVSTDPVSTFSPETRLSLFNGIFFIPAPSALAHGMLFAFDGGQQEIYKADEKGYELRHVGEQIKDKEEKEKAREYLNERLQGDEFTLEQKWLFHQARNAIWSMIGILVPLLVENENAINRLEQSYQEKLKPLNKQLSDQLIKHPDSLPTRKSKEIWGAINRLKQSYQREWKVLHEQLSKQPGSSPVEESKAIWEAISHLKQSYQKELQKLNEQLFEELSKHQKSISAKKLKLILEAISHLKQSYQEELQKLHEELSKYPTYMSSEENKDVIYLSNHQTGQRLRPLLLEHIFEVIEEKFKQQINGRTSLEKHKLKISEDQIGEVKALFMDVHYRW